MKGILKKGGEKLDKWYVFYTVKNEENKSIVNVYPLSPDSISTSNVIDREVIFEVVNGYAKII